MWTQPKSQSGDFMKNIALLGNPNCGKSALYNRLTHGFSRVGNFPGMTVEKRSARLYCFDDCIVTDLPGTNSLDAGSPDEAVAVSTLRSKPDAVICVVDATAPERGLSLALACAAYDVHIVIAVNMVDELKKIGGSVDCESLSKSFGVPVFAVSAITGEGVDELAHGIPTAKQCPIRFDENDPIALTTARFVRADRITRECFVIPEQNKADTATDPLLCGILGRLMIVALFAFIFYTAFGGVGSFLSKQFEILLSLLAELLRRIFSGIGMGEMLRGYLIDGAFAGITAVLGFFPRLAILTLELSLLQDTGILSRIAFLADPMMRRLKLSGNTLLPMLFGFGCTVPGLMSLRLLGDEEERKRSLLLLPFVPCGAKFPVYAVLTTVFFRKSSWLVIIGLYLFPMMLIGLLAVVGKSRTQDASFVLEIPPYRMPSFGNTVSIVVEKLRGFLKKVFTTVFFASTAIWLLSHTKNLIVPADSAESSLLASLGGLLLPIFSPLGWKDWKIPAIFITGLTAKESVLSAWSLLNVEKIPIASAVSFLIFFAFYPPCISALGTIRSEFGKAAVVRCILLQTLIAYVLSGMVYFLFSLG